MEKNIPTNSTPTTSVSQEKSSEQLSSAELEVYENQLIALRTRIRGDVSTMTDEAAEAAGNLTSAPLHMADVGTDNFEREQTLSFIQSDSKTLKLIEGALARIKKGTYGTCEDCGCTIPKARLNVLPYAASCIQCVEQAHQNRVVFQTC